MAPLSFERRRNVVIGADAELELSGPRAGRSRPGGIVLSADVTELECRQSEKRDLGLSFFREARSSASIYYSFLSYYKVIQLAFRESGNRITDWITENVGQIRDSVVRQRVQEIMENEENLVDYLWTAGRCAIAHTSREPLVDPDNLDDRYRIQRDLPIVSGLARLIIESEILDDQAALMRDERQGRHF